MYPVTIKPETQESSMSRINGSLDANIIVRLLTNDIPEQYKLAQKLITSGAEFEVADTAIIESIYALNEYYKIPRLLVKETVQALYTNKNMRINTLVFDEALMLFVKQPALSIEDCYLTSLAKHHKALPLWTFDKKLASQSKGLAKDLSKL
jgi:predicted nucleic acid-binding protein